MKNKKSTLVVSALVGIIIAVVVLFLVVIPACNKIRSLSADSSSLVVDRSSGAPLPGQTSQCEGSNTFVEKSGMSHRDTANFICEQEGKIPIDAEIHYFLANLVGFNKCGLGDVAQVKRFLEESGCEAPGETVGGITIDQTTVDSSLCTYSPMLIGAMGIIYGGNGIVGNTISFMPGIHNPDDLLPYLKENTEDLVDHCTSNNKPFCFLLNPENTRISDLNEDQQNALTRYCVDILPSGKPFTFKPVYSSPI